ncbi:porin family protein [bacterium]|nr:porin family protein [bacterium]
MIKSKIIVIVCSLMLMIVSSVFAAEGVYVSGNIGASILNDSDLTNPALPGVVVETGFDTGLLVSGALGVQVGKGRVEAEIGYRTADIDSFQALGVSASGDGDASALSFMVNAYLDIKTESAITPYLGGGLGMAKIELDNVSVSGIAIGNEDDTVFAYQFGGGIGYAMSEKATLDLGYRYFATEDLNLSGTDANYGSHNLTIGIRFGL